MTEIKIEKLLNDGRGIGRDHHGRVWMVAGVIPGEVVRVAARRRHKDHVDGICEEVLAPVPGRRQPPCRYFGRCGGCQLQHMDDRLQPDCKRDFIVDTLIRSGGLSLDASGSVPPDIIPAREPLAYRQRIRLMVDNSGAIGFRQGGSHRIVTIDSCLIARPALNLVLAEISAMGIPASLGGLVREIILEESPAAETVFLTLVCRRCLRPREIKAAAAMGRSLELEKLFCVGSGFSRINPGGESGGMLRFEMELNRGKTELVVEPGGFCQVNQAQNLEMVRLVCALAGQGRRILDLFCGAGNFSIPLARDNEVVGFDLQRAAIRAAEINRERNQVEDSSRFFRAAAVDGLERMIKEGRGFDLVILDPPRTGCRELMDRVCATGAEEIIYISCDPATLARDLAVLRRKYGYRPEQITAVDMFPQTRHVETVVKLLGS